MPTFFQFVLIVTALFFLGYGFQAITSQMMTAEFRRFGLNDAQRKLTGALQIAGAAGLLIGMMLPIIGLLAATGLSMMMLIAFIIRIKIRDGLMFTIPSLLFMLVNMWLTVVFYVMMYP